MIGSIRGSRDARQRFSRSSQGRRDRKPARGGFTLAELLVTLVVFSIILTAVMAMFVVNSRLARSQMHLTGMQQSQRAAQYALVRSVRMAGRGGLPTSQYPVLPAYAGQLLPDGLAIGVDNNVAAGTEAGTCTGADSNCANVLEGTDVLTVRGVFNSPVYQLNPAAGDFSYDSSDGTGSLRIRHKSPTGVPQDLTPFEDLLGLNGDPLVDEALVLVSPLDDEIYAIVELDSGGSAVTQVGGVTEIVNVAFTTSGTHGSSYLDLSPGGSYPVALTTVAYVGILEEYRFYVREAYAIAGDTSSEVMPRLSRARVFPGTDDAHAGDDANLNEDFVDNILDLQVALGVDTTDGLGNRDGVVLEGDGVDTTPTADDEWLFNHTGDDPTEIKWANNVAAPSKLFYLRINTLARTDRPDTRFQAPLLTLIEDKDYTSAPFDDYNTRDERIYRRRVLQTIVDLRNL